MRSCRFLVDRIELVGRSFAGSAHRRESCDGIGHAQDDGDDAGVEVAASSIVANASGGLMAFRYGRSEVMASNASATATMRLSIGISSPASPRG